MAFLIALLPSLTMSKRRASSTPTPRCFSLAYTVNNIGQRTNLTEAGTAITGQPAGRVHDQDGTLPVDQTGNATLVWDAENRLVAITKADNTVIYYSYDAQSRRISKQIDTAPVTS